MWLIGTNKKLLIAGLASIFVCLVVLQSCTAEAEQRPVVYAGYLQKDLSEQMDALQVYQGSIGEEIKRGTLQNADWLLEGMDSVLLLVKERLNNHARLQKPFEKYYEQKMKAPVAGLRQAIATNDTALAREQYTLLVNRCNSCHNDHEVEEKAHF